jgi:hypothetical protein
LFINAANRRAPVIHDSAIQIVAAPFHLRLQIASSAVQAGAA